MSDDLISRKEAVKMLRDYADLKCFNEEIELANGILKAVCYIESDNIPTAYDVDKVIDEIEKIISSYKLCVETSLKEIENKGEDEMSFEICSLHNNRGYLNGLRKALEIVKSGGVADE